VGLAHVLKNGESLPTIADAYVELTDIYLPRDLSKAIQKENPNFRPAMPRAGERIVIPSVVKRAPKSADDERIGWPEDKHLRGVYVRGGTAGGTLYQPLLDRMVERGMNMIVLDSKDYDGLVTYKSKVPLAVETGATEKAPVRDMARTVRFAHAKGIRVAMRVSCFEDEFIAHAKPDLLPRANWAPNKPYQIGWLDPANPGARGYIKDLVKEALDFGVDEIELDYVRYPVLGVKNADFDATKGKTPKTIVIRDFVREVHALTQARKVPLSLDIFGIVAEGVRADIDALGQDPVLLAPECEALSPMVYPSHYKAGYAGFDVPGNHPEIVGMATRKILAMLKHGKVSTLIRPWLQAASWNSPEYGPPYIAAEVKSAISAGSHGWLMWNPAQTYTVTWQALPPIEKKKQTAPAADKNTPPEPTAQAD
ncbi:MAG: putative glycoside hydrolase, partial [Polyangiaceae bacterium]